MIQGPLRKIRKHRDIVMIDQRGTGQSNKLDCPPDESIDPLNAEIDFELSGSDGNTYRLADYLGKQAVVIAWFPKAFTGG